MLFVFNNFLTMPVDIEQTCKTKTCTCYSYTNGGIEMLPLVADKTINLSNQSKEAIYLLSLLLINSLSLMSAMNGGGVGK